MDVTEMLAAMNSFMRRMGIKTKVVSSLGPTNSFLHSVHNGPDMRTSIDEARKRILLVDEPAQKFLDGKSPLHPHDSFTIARVWHEVCHVWLHPKPVAEQWDEIGENVLLMPMEYVMGRAIGIPADDIYEYQRGTNIILGWGEERTTDQWKDHRRTAWWRQSLKFAEVVGVLKNGKPFEAWPNWTKPAVKCLKAWVRQVENPWLDLEENGA